MFHYTKRATKERSVEEAMEMEKYLFFSAEMAERIFIPFSVFLLEISAKRFPCLIGIRLYESCFTTVRACCTEDLSKRFSILDSFFK